MDCKDNISSIGQTVVSCSSVCVIKSENSLSSIHSMVLTSPAKYLMKKNSLKYLFPQLFELFF